MLAAGSSSDESAASSLGPWPDACSGTSTSCPCIRGPAALAIRRQLSPIVPRRRQRGRRITPVQEPGQSPGLIPRAGHDDHIPPLHQRDHREPAPPGTLEPTVPRRSTVHPRRADRHLAPATGLPPNGGTGPRPARRYHADAGAPPGGVARGARGPDIGPASYEPRLLRHSATSTSHPCRRPAARRAPACLPASRPPRTRW